jgi:3-polyprenyl-4-hydroxybenzoate decarboxylase
MEKDLGTFPKQSREADTDFYVEGNQSVKSKYETWVLQEKMTKEGCFPVIYYPIIEGFEFPVVSNLLGSRGLFGLALGLDPKKSNISKIFDEYRRRKGKTKPFKTISPSELRVRKVILKGQ